MVGAFADADWRVIAQPRRPLADRWGDRVRELGLPVSQHEAAAAAAASATVVVNAMNPLYTRWGTEALPLNDAAVSIARLLRATLMLPGNVYNYGSPLPGVINESTPQRPTNRKGEIRLQMEAAMRSPGVRSIVIRTGDLFGGPGTGSWMDLAVIKDLARGRITYPGPRDRPHACAYLPDLARTFLLLTEARGRLAAHETFLFPGYAPRGNDLVSAITAAAAA